MNEHEIFPQMNANKRESVVSARFQAPEWERNRGRSSGHKFHEAEAWEPDDGFIYSNA